MKISDMLLPDLEKRIVNFKRIIAKYEAMPIESRPGALGCFYDSLAKMVARRSDLIGRKKIENKS